MTSLEKLKLYGAVLHMRRLWFVFHDNWDGSVDQPFSPVVVTLEVLPALLWWAQPSNVLQGVLLASLINQFEVERHGSDRTSPDWDLAL